MLRYIAVNHQHCCLVHSLNILHTFASIADVSDEEGLEADLSFIGSHAFARMEGDVDKQRRLILQGQLSEAALQKQHQRK